MADKKPTGRELMKFRYAQLEGHLKGLRADSKKLESLVAKYGKIHDEGAGRRLLFTLKESGGLTDLRRRIGLHEQMLQIWYMTLVYGSLRRLESGQQGILSAIEAMNTWSRSTMRKIQQSLREGDSKPLERELRKSGLEPQVVNEALGTAVDYVEAPPLERVRMQSYARSSAAVYPEETSFRPSPRPSYQEYSFDKPLNDDWPSYPPPPPKPHTHRHRHSKRDAGDKHKEENPSIKEREKPSKGQDATYLMAEFGRPRSSSQTPKPTPPSPLLVVPDTIPRHRPASYHQSSDQYDRLSPDVGGSYKQEQFITIDKTPRRHRSVSRELNPEDRDRRNQSTHSYVRRRSASRGDNGEEKVEG